jgi:hypothetical protein
VDFDRQQDFSRYRTFKVEVGPLVRADGVTDEQNTLAKDRIRRARERVRTPAREIERPHVSTDAAARVS